MTEATAPSDTPASDPSSSQAQASQGQASQGQAAHADAAQAGRASRGRRGRGPRSEGRLDARADSRGDRKPWEHRDSRGRRLDLSPPRFNVDELFALAGAPLWQAVHEGTVAAVTEVAVLVDLAPQGHPPVRAAVRPVELPGAQPGQKVSVRLLDPPVGDAVPTASVVQARDLSRFEQLKALKETPGGVDGRVVREVKGGYSVALFAANDDEAAVGDGAIRAFMPASQATLSRFGPSRSEKILGLQDRFDVSELDLERGNIVVSRKSRLVAERDKQSAERLATLSEGAVVSATVKSIVPYGAFLDVGGLDGLLHKDDLSWDGRGRVESILREGQTLNVQVLSKNGSKLKLGLKQLMSDPWAEIRAAYVEGSVVEGVIVALADFGAFVRLPLPSRPSEGIEGLIHVSEISWNKVKHPSAKFQIGQTITVKVLGLDTDNRRISLSTRALEKNPFEAVLEQFPVGTVVKAKVKSLAEFGAFLELSDAVDGMVHIGELSWTDHVKHPSEVLTIGQEVEAVVMNVDVGRQRVSCSIKRAKQNPFDVWEKKYAAGTRHKLKVVRVEDKGATLEVEHGLSCFCNWRDLLDKAGSAVERAQDAVKMGEEIEVEVRAFDRKFKKVSVSMKAVVEGDTRAAYDDYKKKEQSSQVLNPLADKLKALTDKKD